MFSITRFDEIKSEVWDSFIDDTYDGWLFHLPDWINLCKTFKAKNFSFGLFEDGRLVASGMIGIPTETEQEVENTIDFALKLSKLHSRFQAGLGTCIPYVGVPMAKMCEKLGWKVPQTIFDWSSYQRYNVEKLELSWIPWITWITSKKRKRLNMVYRYIRLINGYSNIDYYGKWRRLAFKLLSNLAYFRVKYSFFWFPIELSAYNGWMNFRNFLGRMKNIRY